MERRKQRGHKRWSWLHHVVTLSAVLVVLFSALSATGWADALYILTGIEDTAIVLKEDAYVSALASKQVYLSETGNSRDVILTEGQTVTIRHGDNNNDLVVVSKHERVSELLDRMHVEMSPLEMISIQIKDENNIELLITEDLTYYDRETVAAPRATVRVPNDKLPVGTEQVVQEGQDGERTCVYEVVWSGGEMLSRQLVEEATNNTVDRIVEYGVTPEPEPEPEPKPVPEPKPEPEPPANNSSLPMDKLVDVRKNGDGTGTLVFKSGRMVKYRAIKNMTATAYNKNEPKVGTITAMGTKVHKGVVAVDRRVIKLGTKMYIVANGYEYGYSVAEDTGVSGNVIDLYFESYSGMQQFGRRPCTVYILE